MLIDGALTRGAGGRTFTSLNPATGEVTEALDEFDPTRSARALEAFVDQLDAEGLLA